MKKSIVQYCLVFFSLVISCQGLRSQELFKDTGGERIQAWTDRTVYVSGERALFSAVIYDVQDGSPKNFSRIIYCELITPEGKRITGGKYPVQNSCGHGCLTIPEETISGIYFLKFYTRFMRNGSISDYKYIMLKIINPYKTEVLKGSNGADTSWLKQHSPENNTSPPSITITSGKNAYSPREEIRLNIQADTLKSSLTGLSLTVIPESTFGYSFSPLKNRPDTNYNETYIPETRGISISGQLIVKESHKPVPDARVNLSIIGDRDILVVRTNSSGRFFFALPDYTGSRDIFLCADELLDFATEILIDNDFCSRPVSLPSPAFSLDDEEMRAGYKLAVNSRISTVFMKNTPDTMASGQENKSSFYGKPSSVLIVDKYIDLPTLEDYFTELPVIVKVRKVKGKKQFRFFTENIEMSMFDPIVLVDWVPVNNIEKILAMSPRDIDRVELVEYPYIKGDITFGGIISFISKKNDFAGIDLPKSGTFVNYSFLEDCPDEVQPAELPANIPDPRNTVYWNPAVQFNDDGKTEIIFTAPDTPGNYLILLRGMTMTGEEFLIQDLISIKKK
jgi:hypothetical protein